MCADLLNLQSQVTLLEKNNFDMLHLDVMDQHFVPNLTLGFDLINQLNTSILTLDVHLMIENIIDAVNMLKTRPSDFITFHVEAPVDIDQTINEIKNKPSKVGLSINPETPVEKIFPYLDKVDMILMMCVHPGFAGQSFITKSYDRGERLINEIKKRNLDMNISVDGGIGMEQINRFSQLGVNTFILGTKGLFFKDKTLEENISTFNKFRFELSI